MINSVDNKDLSFFINIESVLYSNSSISNKLKTIILYIDKFYKPTSVAFVTKYKTQKKYKILSSKEEKKQSEIDLFSKFNKIDLLDAKLVKDEVIIIVSKDKEYSYILPINKVISPTHSSLTFLYLEFNRPFQEIEKLNLLLKMLQNFYKYSKKVNHLKEEYKKIKLLYEISKTIDRLNEVNLKNSLSKIMKLIKNSIYYDYFSLYIKEENDVLNPIELDSPYQVDLLHTFEFHLGKGLSAWVAEAMEPVIVNNLASQKRFRIGEEKVEKDVNSIISIPLLSKDRVIGVLNLARIFPYRFYKRELKTIEIIGTQIASVLENVKLLEKLENMAFTDGLTGIFNYRYFIQEFEKELKRADRYKYQVSIILIDLDDFKVVNDLYGHETGNKVLKKLTNLISRELRSIDVFARYGGEEFIILLPNTGKEGALILAERLRKKVEKEFSMKNFDSLPSVTITLGISSFPDDGADIYDIMKKADIALYTGKRKGKNISVIYSKDYDKAKL